MRHSTQGRIQRQVSFLRRQFLQDGGLAVHGRALGGGRLASTHGDWRMLERQNLHAAGDALGVPGASAQRRPLLPCRSGPPDCASRLAGAQAVQLGDGRLLPGEEAAAGAVLLRRGLPRGAKPGRAGRLTVALEGPPRLPVRRLDGLHARHPGEPPGVPADLQSEARDGFPVARIGAIISLSCGAILNLGICRYAGKGQGEVSLLRQLWDVLSPRRRPAGGPLDVGLGRDVPAPAARGRHRQPPDGPPPGRLPQGDAPGQGRPHCRVDEADVDPLGGPADVQRAARLDHGPRGADPRRAARIPDRGRSSS